MGGPMGSPMGAGGGLAAAIQARKAQVEAAPSRTPAALPCSHPGCGKPRSGRMPHCLEHQKKPTSFSRFALPPGTPPSINGPGSSPKSSLDSRNSTSSLRGVPGYRASIGTPPTHASPTGHSVGSSGPAAMSVSHGYGALRSQGSPHIGPPVGSPLHSVTSPTIGVLPGRPSMPTTMGPPAVPSQVSPSPGPVVVPTSQHAQHQPQQQQNWQQVGNMGPPAVPGQHTHQAVTSSSVSGPGTNVAAGVGGVGMGVVGATGFNGPPPGLPAGAGYKGPPPGLPSGATTRVSCGGHGSVGRAAGSAATARVSVAGAAPRLPPRRRPKNAPPASLLAAGRAVGVIPGDRSPPPIPSSSPPGLPAQGPPPRRKLGPPPRRR